MSDGVHGNHQIHAHQTIINPLAPMGMIRNSILSDTRLRAAHPTPSPSIGAAGSTRTPERTNPKIAKVTPLWGFLVAKWPSKPVRNPTFLIRCHIYVCTCVCWLVCVRVHMYVHIHIYICMHIHVCICIENMHAHVHTYIHTFMMNAC